MVVSDALFYDPFTFRKHFKNIGRAYREQATTLIEICRLYAEASPQTYTKNDSLQKIFRLADAALTEAGKAKKRRTPAATDAFLLVQDEIVQFGSPPPNDTPGTHRKKLPDPNSALLNAAKKDEKSTGILSTIKSIFPAPDPKGPTKKVNFVVLESPHERREEQPIVNQEIDNSTTTAEIIWRFSRYPEESGRRITARQNPHFYLELSENAASYSREFQKDSLKDFGHGLETGGTIYILLDKSCLLFLDAAKPRIFGNLWKPRQRVVLKDVGGTLESEDVVLRKIEETPDYRHDYWHRPSITDPSQRRVQTDYSYDDGEIVKKPVGSWHALLNSALKSQKLISWPEINPGPTLQRTRAGSPGDIDQNKLPSPEPVQGLGEQTTPRQSTMGIPWPEYSARIPNTSGSSIDGTTLSPSTESSETLVHASEVHPPTQVTTGNRPQFVDRGIHHAMPRQSARRLTHREYAISTTSVPSVSGGVPFPSKEFFETPVNASEVPPPMQVAAAVKPPGPQSVDSRVDQTTPRQTTTPLPQPEYPIPKTGVPSIVGSTLSPSTESFETLNSGAISPPNEFFETPVNASGVPPPMLTAAEVIRPGPQSVVSRADQTTPRQSAIRLPQPEYSVPNRLSPSTESLETLVHTSDVPPCMATPDKRPQSADHGIYHVTSRQSAVRPPQPEHSISNTLSPSTESFEALVNSSGVPPPIRVTAVKRPSPLESVDSRVEQTTSSATRLPQPEYSTPVNTSEVSLASLPTQAALGKRPQSIDSGVDQTTLGGSTLFSSSTESFETLVDASDVSLPMQAAVAKPPKSVDSGIDPTTPKQSAPCLPKLEYPSLGGSALSVISTDSFETLAITSEGFHPTAAGKRPQSVDSGIDLQLEVPTADTLLTTPTSAPVASLLVSIPSPQPAQNREQQSAPPVRKWETHGNWFKKYIYDYDAESWRPRDS
ncbi:hypothetical protein EI94DRAFT_1787225 [Lactarius quietus]|nr:hypothetical protein EI94DRAFT_1787225 [Lactarius quietus]